MKDRKKIQPLFCPEISPSAVLPQETLEGFAFCFIKGSCSDSEFHTQQWPGGLYFLNCDFDVNAEERIGAGFGFRVT